MAKGTWKATIGGSAFADYTDVFEPSEGGGAGKNIIEVQGYGAAAAVFLDLGNFKIPRRFTLTRTHATDTLAEAFRQTAVATWAGVATVVLTHIDYTGTETTFTITNAKVELDQPQRIGLTTITKINFTGGPAT
ncbi:MAG: hypothetical protein P4N60_19130 [Verrucomicrobiae bacterium]|nr:hypothetical protein [Verrucomicrobiae bacterium]